MSQRAFTVAQVALVFLGVIVGLAMAGGAVGLLMEQGFSKALAPAPVTAIQAHAQVPPEPRLQVDPLADRSAVLGPERRASTYGRGHIPVEQAMRQLAAQGWPQPEAGR